MFKVSLEDEVFDTSRWTNNRREHQSHAKVYPTGT
jgi:hypothetical protein